MWQYLLKRLILFIPTIFVVSVATFFLSKMTPGDPVAAHFMDGYTELDYELEAQRRGLDQPSFYFSIQSAAYPDTLYKIVNPERRKTFEYLIGQFGNAEAVQSYYQSMVDFKKIAMQIDTPAAFSTKIKKQAKAIFFYRDEIKILESQTAINQILEASPPAALNMAFN